MTHGSRRRAGLSTGALLGASAATLAALLAAQPHVPGSPVSWSGDELAYATTWLVAVACAAWLTVITTACVAAIAGGRRDDAQRIARWAPPMLRRILQAALVTTWVVVPAAAYALPASPIVLHVGPGGRLTTIGGPSWSTDNPVVRAPQPTTAPTTVPPARRPSPVTPSSIPVASTPPASTPSTPPVLPPTTAPAEPPAPVLEHPAPANPNPAVAGHASTPPSARTYVVRAGDNLWRIARAEVVHRTHASNPGDATIARYWRLVIAANRSTLRSGNPSLIFPGEIVTLP